VRTGIGRVVEIDTDALPVLPTGRFHEVWFVGRDDGAERPNRTSAGTFHPDAQGRSPLRLTAAVDPARFPALAITAEPADGNPAAGGPVVLHADLRPR
jgi:hypothetical protein